MSDNKRVSAVEVGVALVRCEDRILLTYNQKWGAFSLPMTKRRTWTAERDLLVEGWEDCAARAGAEALGKTCTPGYLPISTL